MKKIITFFVSCFFLLHVHAQPYQLSLLKDISSTSGSNAHGFIEMNGIWYFSAYSANEGSELWRTDGTTAGTYLVKDINPGTADGDLEYYPNKLNNKIYFSATTAANGNELWSSDGTTAGTQMVADINPGTAGSFIFQTTVYNNKIYFVVNTPTYGEELWGTDGTAAGTQIVKDINPGLGSAGISLSRLSIVNDKLLFTANDGTNGSRLWSTDGTAAGTKMISPTMNVNNIIGAGSTTMNNNIYFPGTAGGTQLWKSDGTEAGTMKVADIVSVTGGSGINIPVTVGNNIFFKVGTKELWKSDGTAAGTVLVKNMEAVSNGGTFSPQYMLAYDNNTLIFTCNYTFSWEANPWGCELWKSDGTDAGTTLVKSFTTLNGSVGVTPNNFTKYNGKYYFMAYKSGAVYYELWKTDATPAGTTTVRNTTQFDGSYPDGITVANGLMYYITWGASGSTNYGLWQSDGTDAGTQKITETGAGCQERPSTLAILPTKAIMIAKAIENTTGNYYGDEPYVTNIPAKPTCTLFNTPTISITSNASGAACPGTPISFNATATYAGTGPAYQWKKNSVNIGWATGSTFSINSLNNNDTISCVLSSNADCITGNTAASNKIIVSVLAAPLPTVSANGPLTFCQGGSVTLTASLASSYLWSNGATARSITINASGSFSVTVTNTSGCKGTSASKIITVNALPAPTVSADNLTTFCQGGSVTLTASAATGYLWSNGATTQNITVTASGNYNVTVTNASGCSASSAATNVTVNPLPLPTVTANGSTTFCAGGSVTLSSSTANYYTWYNELNEPVWYQQSFSATDEGSYHVTVGDANGCEGSSAATAVTTNPLPEPTITASGPTTFCQGGSVTLTAPNGYSSYLWSTGATSKNIIVNTYGYYAVTVINSNGCAGTSNQVFVSVNALPVPTVTANGPLSFCQGSNVKLTANNGYSSYVWSNGATTKAITVNTAGNYTVTVTDAATGCTGTSAAKTVTVNALPVPAISANGSLAFCQGSNVTLTASDASTYLWSTGAKTKSITVNTAGNYSVTVTNSNGCSGGSAITKITVNPVPQPTITADGPTTFCSGSNVKLTSSANGTYLWSNGATTKSITVSTAGSYNVTVTSNGCSGTSPSASVIVNPLPVPTVTVSGTTTNLCPGATVTLTANAGFKTYLWSNGASTRSIVVNTAGTYSVTVTNNSNCSATSSVTRVTYVTCPVPKVLKATLISSAAVTFTWNAATCSAGYQLQYKPVSAPSWTTVIVTSPTYSATGLLAATTYQWQVATVCQNSPLILSAYAVGNNFTTTTAAAGTFAASVNTKQNNDLFSVLVSPNPSRSNAVLHINGAVQKVHISITDMSGKTLWKSMNVHDRQINLPVEKLANGMYLVTVINDKETRVVKLIKE